MKFTSGIIRNVFVLFLCKGFLIFVAHAVRVYFMHVDNWLHRKLFSIPDYICFYFSSLDPDHLNTERSGAATDRSVLIE